MGAPNLKLATSQSEVHGGAGRTSGSPLAASPAGDYAVGHCRPPQEHRFPAGQSGNPRGRPKGSKNRPTVPGPREEKLQALILEESYRPISVNDATGKVTISMAQAVLRSVAVNAAKGSHRAQRHFTELLAATERDRKRESDDALQTAIQYKYDWEQQLLYRKQHGISGPDPIPHPDDVVIDLDTGTVSFTGPITKEQKEELESAREAVRQSETMLASLRAILAKNPGSQKCIEDVEREEYSLALKQYILQVRSGGDAASLPFPVEPPSMKKRSA